MAQKAILRYFIENPRKRSHIEDIIRAVSKVKLKRTTVWREIHRLYSLGVFKSEIFGKTKILSLNLENDQTLLLLSKHEIDKKEELFKRVGPNIRTLLKKLIAESLGIREIRCVLIFGSYAKAKERLGSDIDILIIFNSLHKIHSEQLLKNYHKNIKSAVRGVINDIEYSGDIKINPIIVEDKEFSNAMRKNKVNVLTEAFKYHVLLLNPMDFWQLIGITLRE